MVVSDPLNPKISGDSYVSNPDAILTVNEVNYLNSLLADLERTTTNEFAVVVVNSIGDAIPKDYAHQLFNNWGVGKAGKDNGLLLLVVMDQRRIEVETGYGMEPVLPDLLVKNVQLVEMVPHFKTGNAYAGIRNGVEAYCQIMKEPENVDLIASYGVNPEPEEGFFARLFGTEEEKDMEATANEGFNWDVINGSAVFFLFYFIYVVSAFSKHRNTIDSMKDTPEKPISFPPVSWTRWWILNVVLPIIFLVLYWKLDVHFVFDLLICLYGYVLILCIESVVRLSNNAKAEEDFVIKCKKFRLIKKNLLARAIFFPLPLLFYYRNIRKKVHALRNQPRNCPECNSQMSKLNEWADNRYLKSSEKVEERIRSIDYDVWKCGSCEYYTAIDFENFYTSYRACEICSAKTYSCYKRSTIKSPTYTSTGLGMKYYQCKNCDHQKEVEYVIAKKQRSSSSSSSRSSSSRSSSSSSSSGSWGGGSSGGGGAGSSW